MEIRAVPALRGKVSGQRQPDPPQQSRLVARSKLVFPNAKHTPPILAERPRYEPVARRIPLELALPKRAIVHGQRTVLWTGVPETAIHEDSDAELVESEVGLPRKLSVPAPARNALGAE